MGVSSYFISFTWELSSYFISFTWEFSGGLGAGQGERGPARGTRGRPVGQGAGQGDRGPAMATLGHASCNSTPIFSPPIVLAPARCDNC